MATLRTILVFLLLTPCFAKGNGVVDIGVEREEKQIQALIRTKNDIFVSLCQKIGF